MKRLAIMLALAATPAFAQQQTLEQRLGAQIGSLVIQNAALSDQVERLQARVKQLEDKYEPKTEPNK